MKNLVIVESPSKSKTIEKYLGKDYKVISSKGHVRDLATSGKFGLGVDVENDFKPNYIPIKGKKKLITDMKKDVKDADKVYLATDPDREGEAISWHLFDALGLKENDYERVEFHEITKDVVKDAFNHTRKIDDSLVKSQETRRIIDRIIGFRLSKLMQSKTGGKSAGRVQSVALKLIVDREREIENFKEEEYYTIHAIFKEFEAELQKYKNKKIEIKSQEDADKILNELDKKFSIANIESKEKNKKGKMPFKTSTLQKDASSKLGFGSSKTMRIAQKLYEGIDIGSETTGLITYMRTDSMRLSPVFVNETFDYIKNNYGENYVGSVKQGKKDENMQDAHEGIRPTSIYRTPESLKQYLTPEEYKLYRLIYYRSLASLMKDAKVKATSVTLENNDYQFKANGSILVFDGYLKVYSDYEKNEDVILPDFNKYENIIESEEIVKEQHFTKPPARYTEASLIDEMESLGIGRPSTYAPTMETLKKRAYVTIDNKKFIPTEVGIETTDKLQEFFSNIINVEYTANMEHDLDEIALDKCDNIVVLKDFYNIFEPIVEDAFKNMEKKEAKETGESCPECDSPLVIRRGKYGEFIACSNYPECKFIKKKEVEVKEIMSCPKCQEGTVIEKNTRRGKTFWGCNRFPTCDFASWYEPVEEKCPECSGVLVKKKDKLVCINCEYEKEESN